MESTSFLTHTESNHTTAYPVHEVRSLLVSLHCIWCYSNSSYFLTPVSPLQKCNFSWSLTLSSSVHFFLLLFSCWLNFVFGLVGSQPGQESSSYFNLTPPIFRCYLFLKKVCNKKVVPRDERSLKSWKIFFCSKTYKTSYSYVYLRK